MAALGWLLNVDFAGGVEGAVSGTIDGDLQAFTGDLDGWVEATGTLAGALAAITGDFTGSGGTVAEAVGGGFAGPLQVFQRRRQARRRELEEAEAVLEQAEAGLAALPDIDVDAIVDDIERQIAEQIRRVEAARVREAQRRVDLLRFVMQLEADAMRILLMAA